MSSQPQSQHSHVRSLLRWATKPTTVMSLGAVSALVAWAVASVTINQPYWFDEAQTLYYLRQPFLRMVEFVAHDFAPPLYHSLLYVWVRLFSDTPVVTALPSVFFGLVSIALTYRFARRMSLDPRWAAMACWLYASSFVVLWYSQETRMYTMLLALAMASTLAWHQLLTTGSRSAWWWYLLFTVLGVYTHHPFWFLVCAQNLATLAARWMRVSRVSPWGWVSTQLLLILAYLPWLPVLVDRVLHWYLPGVTILTQVDLVRDLPCVAMGSVFAPFCRWGQQVVPSVFSAVVAGIGGAALLASTVWVRLRGRSLEVGLHPAARLIPVVTLAIFVAVPLLAIGLLEVDLIQYAITITPFFCCWLMLGASRITPEARGWAVGLALIIAAASLNSYYLGYYVPRTPAAPHLYRTVIPRVAAYLQAHEQPGDEVILVVGQNIEAMLRWAYHGQLPVVGFLPSVLSESGDRELDRVRWISRMGITDETVGAVMTEVAGYRAVWLPGATQYNSFDPDNLTAQWFADHCTLSKYLYFASQPPFTLLRYTDCQAQPSHKINRGGA